MTRPFKNDKDAYYTARTRFNALLGSGTGETAEAAELFYYLNRTGFNGLCRFNKNGRFNVPFGRHTTINYINDFTHFREVLEPFVLTVGDSEDVPLHADDLLYVDPPFDATFVDYTMRGFSWFDHQRLARWLAGHAGPVVVSNSATARVIALYGSLGFRIRTLPAPRRISCTGDRTPVGEMLAVRNL